MTASDHIKQATKAIRAIERKVETFTKRAARLEEQRNEECSVILQCLTPEALEVVRAAAPAIVEAFEKQEETPDDSTVLEEQSDDDYSDDETD